MKKHFISIFLLVLSLSVCHAQKRYSVENLEKLSQEELNKYLYKAQRLEKEGKIMNIAGGSSLGVFYILPIITLPSDWKLGNVSITRLSVTAGLALLAVGIPMNSIGKTRLERINTVKSTRYAGIRFELLPDTQYSLVTKNNIPGITFKITF